MRQNLLFVQVGAAIVCATLYAGTTWATPSTDFAATTLAKGTLGEFEVFNHFVRSNLNEDERNLWLSLQKTKGSSDLYVQSNVWQPTQPGHPVASTGWHSHPGHSLIIVTPGTLTNYEGDDPTCTPHVDTLGMAFVDHGGSHVHIIRNEGDVVAPNIAIQLIPAGQPRRIDILCPETALSEAEVGLRMRSNSGHASSACAFAWVRQTRGRKDVLSWCGKRLLESCRFLPLIALPVTQQYDRLGASC